MKPNMVRILSKLGFCRKRRTLGDSQAFMNKNLHISRPIEQNLNVMGRFIYLFNGYLKMNVIRLKMDVPMPNVEEIITPL